MAVFKFILFLLIFALFSLANNALAYFPQRGNVHTILGPYIFKTNYDGTGAISPDSGGLSLVILGDVNDRGSLEITTTFMNKMYFRKSEGLLLSEKAQVVHVSIGYRHWVDSTVSASMALYSSYPMANAEIIKSEFPPDQQPSTTARENTETGIDFGLQKEVWSNGRFALSIEGRYSLALTKKSDEHADQYGALIGIRYFIQGRDPQ